MCCVKLFHSRVDRFNILKPQQPDDVPLKMYFNERGMVKLKLGVAKGKKLADKRETSAKRDWDRQKSRIMKEGMKAKL